MEKENLLFTQIPLYMKGSTWRKWDLHFHTPASYDYQNKGVTDREIIDGLVAQGVEVVAVTDHHIIDITRIKNLQTLGKGKITVLPGIEFRAELGGSESIHYIGIFPENCDIAHVWQQIQVKCNLTDQEVQRKGHDKIYCVLKDTCEVVHAAGGLITVHAGGKSNSLESIKNNQEFKKSLKVDIVKDSIDVFELGQVDDQDDYKTIIFRSIGMRRPMIICSDNHNIKNYTIKENLWIKGDPIFETLKQTQYEPVHRIHIGPSPPIDPIIRLNKIEFDFPSDTLFSNQPFCLAGKRTLEFSSNFTCLIGGRGTGKSTILNLIHEKLKPGENRFFQNNKLLSAGGNVPIASSVKIDNDTDEKYIEFLSQNEVEEFALDSQKLTSAVYSRILKRDEKGLIISNELALTTAYEETKKHINNKLGIASDKRKISSINKELETYRKIVESFNSPEYTKINDELKALAEKLTDVTNSIEEWFNILIELETVAERYRQENPSNAFAIEIDKLVKGIDKIVLETRVHDFDTDFEVKKKLAQDVEDKKQELRKYLSGKGLTEENLADIANANNIISAREAEIIKINESIDRVQKLIDGYDATKLTKARDTYKLELEKQITAINLVLGPSNSTIKPVSLILEFDADAAKLAIFGEFKMIFEGALARSNHKGDDILKEILFSEDPSAITTREVLIEKIAKHYSTSVAKNFLQELFADENNFEIYKLACERNMNHFAKFKILRVLYDGRPIDKSSFGQRCTAVLVMLLLLGNNPIIIDEPEAHLDSLLISNYLVDVIKDRKSNRQIIFATHNANFVVNGDADLIHILDITTPSTLTTITSTTIENTATRENLISLEGGRDAFEKRESKYKV